MLYMYVALNMPCEQTTYANLLSCFYLTPIEKHPTGQELCELVENRLILLQYAFPIDITLMPLPETPACFGPC